MACARRAQFALLRICAPAHCAHDRGAAQVKLTRAQRRGRMRNASPRKCATTQTAHAMRTPGYGVRMARA
eukprot:11212090-Lingulodinium_polyedra.AAC.1